MTDGIMRRDGTFYEKKIHLEMDIKKGEIPVIISKSPFNNYPTRPVTQMAIGEYWVQGPHPDTPAEKRWIAIIKVKGRGKFSVKRTNDPRSRRSRRP